MHIGCQIHFAAYFILISILMISQHRFLVRSFTIAPFFAGQCQLSRFSTNVPLSESGTSSSGKGTNPRNKRKKSTGLQFSPKEFTCLSYFRFVPIQEETIEELITRGKGIFSPYPEMKGTILIAKEGVNGAFAIPTLGIPLFKNLMRSIDPGIFGNIDYNIGTKLANVTPADKIFPFRKLVIKRRKEVLTDKIPDLNWQDAGPELPPAQWHKELKTLKPFEEAMQKDDEPILLDCRNTYESNQGTFRHAYAIPTVSFSETWEELDKLLGDTPRDKRILTFCTGGIRCVKVNAYLKQKLGFENIGRLEKGIIAYENYIDDVNQTKTASGNNVVTDESANIPLREPSLFEGKNFLFDRRRLVEDESLLTDGNYYK